MTDDFDVSLRRRLEAVAAAVPLSPAGAVGRVHPDRVRAGSRNRHALAGLVPIVAVIMVGTMVAAVAKVGPFAPGSTGLAPSADSSTSPSKLNPGPNPPQSSTVGDGDFELSIRSTKSRYLPDEAIEIEGAITYVGDEDSVDAAYTSGGPVRFGIVEPVYGGEVWPRLTLADCGGTATLAQGRPLVEQFKKAGFYPSDGPAAASFRAFMEDPQLRLPVGSWHVYAVVGFGPICDRESPTASLRAEVTITVGDSALPAETEPADRRTAITIQTAAQPHAGCRPQYNEGRLVRHPDTGLGITDATGDVVGVVWPFGYTASDEAGVATLYGSGGELIAREGEILGFSGPGPGNDGLIHACNDVRVVDADPTGDLAPSAVQTVDDDGTFRLELRSSKSVYVAGEPLDIEATLAYVGSGQARDFHGGILFTGTEEDGTHSFAPGPIALMCVPRAMSDLPDERELADWRKVRSLPAGTWRISAWFSGSAPACTRGGSSLIASIEVTVVPAGEPARTIPLLAAANVDEVSSDRFCRLDTPHGSVGELALDPTSGLGLASESGDIQPIRWPPGFSAEVLPDGAILYGESGQIVAREGDLMSFPAGTADDGVLTVCGQFLFP